jgi:hypothetical protein
LKDKGFEEERMTKIGWHAFVNSTTLESNKSLYKNQIMVDGGKRFTPTRAKWIKALAV